MKTHYEVLSLTPSATPDEIKQRFQQLARLHHPDKQGDPVVFRRIHQAWKVLGNIQQRQIYDKSLRPPDCVRLRVEDVRIVQVDGHDEYTFTCRCGQEIYPAVLLGETDDIVVCPSCPMVYDTALLWGQSS